MANKIILNAEGEKIWQRLKLRFEWAEGFSLFFLFSAKPLLFLKYRERVKNLCKFRVQTFHQFKLNEPEPFIRNIATFIGSVSENSPKSLLWLDMTANIKDQINAISDALARLNEKREHLNRNFPFPVIIALPAGFEQLARQIAPDLWSIRDFSISLDDYDLFYTDTEKSDITRNEIYELPPAPTPQSLTIINEWDKLVAKGQTSRDVLVAGWNATETALEYGNLEKALQIATKAMEIARTLEKKYTPEVEYYLMSLRDTSISISNMGEAYLASGLLSDAQSAFEESLDIRRWLHDTLGDSPQVLRDLSVSLNNIGETARESGNLSHAQSALEDSLEIRRWLHDTLGDSPQVLRDLSVSLNKIGEIARESGNLSDAQSAFEESLEIRRRLHDTLGDSPQVLRDLSVSLYLNGVLDKMRGEIQLGETHLTEALKFATQLDNASELIKQIQDALYQEE